MPRLEHDRFVRRGSALAFEVDGRSYEALSGETIAAALAAAGRVSFKRDRSGAPRGPLCNMGVCFDCQVSVDDGPAQRACLTKVASGMKVQTLGYWFRPAQTTKQPVDLKEEMLTCEVLIVGAGPAGLSAALRLAENGIRVSLVDERPELGGQFFKPLAVSYSFSRNRAADRQYRAGMDLVNRLRGTDAQLLSEATAWAAFSNQGGGFDVCVATSERSLTVRADKVIIATGAYESVPPFPGWTLPGVMTTGAVQGMVRAYRVVPGQRVLIAGNGPLNLQLASELIECGIHVVAIAESAPNPFLRRQLPAALSFLSSPALMCRGLRYLSRVKRHGIPIHFASHIAAATGAERVEHASIARILDDGQLLEHTKIDYEVDLVCAGYSLQPSNELARLLGCKHVTGARGKLMPVRDANGQTTVDGVFVVGDCGVLGGAHVAMAEGRLAASSILKKDRMARLARKPRDRGVLRRHRRFQRGLWSIYDAPELPVASADLTICRCEQVSAGRLMELIKGGVGDIGSLKRLTRVGMGPCQGRYCQANVAKLLASVRGISPNPSDAFAPRAPAKPALIETAARQQTEWRGYRTVDIPPASGKEAVGSALRGTDVLIIGAGIIGVCTGLYLARAGIDVTIIESGVANGQASGGNAGSLHLQMLSSDFSIGVETEKSSAAHALCLQKLGVETWEELQRETGGTFELEITGGLALAETDDDLKFLERKASVEKSHGIEVEIISGADVRRMAPAVSEKIIGASYCSGEGKINPMLATPHLLREAVESGAALLERCHVAGIEHRSGQYTVATTGGSIRCRRIVNATGAWAAQTAAMVGGVLPVRTAPQQMMVTAPMEPFIHHLLAFSRRHLTMKQAANGNVIIGGGWPAGYAAESNRGINIKESIEGNSWIARHAIPAIGLSQIIRTWATLGVMIDGAPVLGELPGRAGFFNAVGANGYTMGPVLGKITAELITTGDSIVDLRPFVVERFN